MGLEGNMWEGKSIDGDWLKKHEVDEISSYDKDSYLFDIKFLEDRLDTINYRLKQLMIEKESLEDEKTEVEQELKKIHDHLEEANRLPESADSFVGVLDEEKEELFSARDVKNAFVTKSVTTDKKEARKVEEDFLESAEQINDKFREQAENMVSKIEDIFGR